MPGYTVTCNCIFSKHLPVGVPVAHCVVAGVLLVLLVHFEADSFSAALLHFVLVTSILTGDQGGWLIFLIDWRLSALSLELCRLGDGWQQPREKNINKYIWKQQNIDIALYLGDIIYISLAYDTEHIS